MFYNLNFTLQVDEYEILIVHEGEPIDCFHDIESLIQEFEFSEIRLN